jgi:hypothetical protein
MLVAVETVAAPPPKATMCGAPRPKKKHKQKPQKTLKQRRSEKRATRKAGSGPIFSVDK